MKGWDKGDGATLVEQLKRLKSLAQVDLLARAISGCSIRIARLFEAFTDSRVVYLTMFDKFE